MAEVYTGRIDRLEIGLDAINNVDIENVILMNWERNHDVRPRLYANAKTPTTYNQPHSWIVGSFSLLSDHHDAIYATDVVAGGGVEPALVPNADSNVIAFFQVTYRDEGNNTQFTRFYYPIITRGVKELLNYDDSVWIYHFLAGYAVDEATVEALLSSDANSDSIYIHDGITATITTSFSSPDSYPSGLTLFGATTLISAGNTDNSIFIHSGITSTISTSFSSPASTPMGLTLDGSNNLISSDAFSDSIYIHSGITSTITTSFSSPSNNPRDLTLDGSGNLISADTNTDSIYIHSGITSTVTTSFSTPSSDPAGLTIDNDGNLISSDLTSNSVYIHSGITSTITTSFSATGEPRGLSLRQ